ncbi:MAG: magnesium transporter CorA family protein [Actinobacteria bacterium]|nr:magnesium transporter CorA family protein [Actinomycetota bacterium]
MISILKTNPENQTCECETIEKGCWIHLNDPDSDEIEMVEEHTGLEKDFLKAALDKEESSRLEVENDQILVLLDVPVMEVVKTTAIYSTIPLGIVLNNDYIVTVVLQDNNITDDFFEQKIKTFYTFKKSRFILQLLLRIDKYYLSFLKQIDKASKNVETSLQKSLKNKELFDMMELEKSLVYFSTSLKANQTTLEKMMKLKIMQKYPEDEDLLEDVIIENKQAIEMANIYRDIISGTMDAFASIISNNLNVVMKILTSITILMTIPMIVSGFYGMNVPMPWGNFPFAFVWIIVISFVLSGIGLLILFKKKMF